MQIWNEDPDLKSSESRLAPEAWALLLLLAVIFLVGGYAWWSFLST